MGLDLAWLANPDGLLECIAAFLLMAIAVAVFVVNPRRPAHQAFAVLFFGRGATMLMATGSLLSKDAWTANVLTLVGVWSVPVYAAATVWFVSVYPQRRGPLAGHGAWFLLGGLAILETAFVLFPYAFASSFADWPSYQASQLPLGTAIVLAIEACFTLATIVFAIDYVRERTGRRRRSLFFVLLAFSTHQAIDAAASILGANWQEQLAGAITLLGVAVAAILLVGGAMRSHTPGRWRDVAAFSALVVVSAVAGVLAAFGLPDHVGLYLTMFGASRLLTASLMAYALLRSNLLEIDLAVKWTIKRGTVVGIILAAFFVASQLAQTFLPDVLGGPLVGGIVVGLLLFAIAPLQRFAERLSEKAVPDDKPVRELAKDERAAIYLDVARGAWKDGSINRSERSMLNHLQARLGITDAMAKKLEDQAAHP